MGVALADQRTEPRIAFASVDLLHRICTPKRLAILRRMAGAGPLPVREVAQRVGRDVKSFTGIWPRSSRPAFWTGARAAMSFPYDGVRMEVDLKHAA